MKIAFQGRNSEITQRFRDHASPRLATLEHSFDRIKDVRVSLASQRGWRTVEITLEADSVLLRSEERSNDDLASFDKALDKLERQLKRYRERVRDHTRTPMRKLTTEGGYEEAAEPEEGEEVDTVEVAPGEIRILRTKSHELKPMTPEEAALQMELLGHDFFLFFNAQSDQVQVVYRRRDGGYGLIEPTMA
ncbi:ribosome-associated translation inhibitor RaiA [bacterium]|nr:ribosome-associated translation inhibitor RaiA [bacterium]